jgi:tetratricopeptide (TPR) repeat protein
VSTTSAESLATFRRLLEGAHAQPAADAPLALAEALVGPERAPELRRCAIPHLVDREVLQVLAPWLSPSQAAERFEELAELSVMQECENGIAIHDRWRQALFAWWLRAENLAEFETVSRSLAQHFGALAGAGAGPDAEAAGRRHMYHLLGADRRAGVAAFASLCRRARHQWRFAECGALIRLVRDYDPVLTAGERAVVTYHEGKLAADMKDWQRAEALFREVVDEDASSNPLRLNGLVRLGHVLREQGRFPEAIRSLERARLLAASSSSEHLAWRALRELGEAHRDAGQLDLAESRLREAIEAAKGREEPVDLPGLLNSLGTVYLKRREPGDAVVAFQRSLCELERAGDLFRPAQVHNNLALAYSEQGEWARAQTAFAASLASKRQAGDLAGQGLALQNLSRAQAAQHQLAAALESASEAAEIFLSLKDARSAGIAKRSLGQYHRRLRDDDRAQALFEEALTLLDSAKDEPMVRAVRAELQLLRGKVRLPWWAWVLIALGALSVGLLLTLLLVLL